MDNLTFTKTRLIPGYLKALVMELGEEFTASIGNSIGETKRCKELRGISFEILKWDDRSEMMQANGLSAAFAELDVQDRLQPYPVNPGRAVQLDTTGVLSKYLRQDGTLRYTYSERIWYQIPEIVSLLQEYPNTRQAFISVWDPCLDVPVLEEERVPCSIGFHFLLRNGKLNMIYYMRSLEVTKCLGNDIFTSTRLLEEIANRVGVGVGSVTFSVGSLHIFID